MGNREKVMRSAYFLIPCLFFIKSIICVCVCSSFDSCSYHNFLELILESTINAAILLACMCFIVSNSHLETQFVLLAIFRVLLYLTQLENYSKKLSPMQIVLPIA